MAEISTIEWTDATWNPVRGCTKISPGCAHCYASTFAERFRGVPNHPYEQGFDLRLVPEKLLEPLAWSSAKRVFVNSMSDLFHQDVPNEYIRDVAKVMSVCMWHTFQVLTKRSSRLLAMLDKELLETTEASHIWWGVSVEDRKYGVPRIKDLQSSNARVKFLSVEPLLEDLGELDLSQISWVIVGGESGYGARPMQEAWVISIRDQCEQQAVPFFFKQWGGVQKKRYGRLLRGQLYDASPPLSEHKIPSRTKREELMIQLRTRPVELQSDFFHGPNSLIG